jgi:4-hydroxy-3-polyprenylbenzoate decarboxylase
VANAGVYRMQLKSATRLGVFCTTENDSARIWEKYNARGEPMPVAVVVGAPPAVYLSAIQMAPFELDELAIAGGLMQAPVPVVTGKTVPLQVPAAAQVVIEGHIRTDKLEPEGSFGEAHGYCDPRSLSFSLEVSAITHRAEPVWLSIISQLTPSESSKTKQAGYEAQLLRHLREDCGLSGVVNVSLCEELLNRQFAVVVLRKRSPQEPMNALYALQATRQTPKLAVAVDEDIDPHNPLMVIWAIVNRSQPHRDLKVLSPRPMQFGPLRISQQLEGYDNFDSYVLIDATAKTALPPVALPARRFMEEARRRWEQLGLPELHPRTPWHGYSLGMWSDESAEEAELATTGRYYETGAKLMAQSVDVGPGTELGEVRRHDFGQEGKGQ